MALPTPKELKKLADACRKAGIYHFKGDGIEFTLGPMTSTHKASKKSPKQTPIDSTTSVRVDGDWDSLSDLDKIMWSAASLPEVTPENS